MTVPCARYGIRIGANDPGGDIELNAADVGTENAAYIVGPGSASHAMITTYSGSDNTFSIMIKVQLGKAQD